MASYCYYSLWSEDCVRFIRRSINSVKVYVCEDFTLIRSITYYRHVVIFELLVSCVLPLCVIAFTSIMTAGHLVESSRSISEGTKNPPLEARRNTAKIMLGLTVVFLISYVPYHVFWTYIMCTRVVIIFLKKLPTVLFIRMKNYGTRFKFQHAFF
jgi:hypothetical protein